MRVICIDDSEQYADGVHVKKGNVYTVLDKLFIKGFHKDGYRYDTGTYYQLIECGTDGCYLSEMFLEINEDQQDELELVNKKEEVV